MDWGYIWFPGEGRIGRREYWLGGVVPVVIASIVVGVVAIILNYFAELVGNLFAVLPSLFLLYVFVKVSIKRWHDLGRSGIWLVFQLIPFLGFLVTIGLGLMKGQEGKNAYERI